MSLKITFTDNNTSEGYKAFGIIVGSVGTMVCGEITSMNGYIKSTGNATHIGLISDYVTIDKYPDYDQFEILYPKFQVLKISAEN